VNLYDHETIVVSSVNCFDGREFMKIQLQLYMCVIGYVLTYFLMTTCIYVISILTGYDGLGIPLVNGKDDGAFYYEQAINLVKGLPYIETSSHIVIMGWIFKIFNTDNVLVIRIFNYSANVILLILALLTLKKTEHNKAIYLTSAIILTLLLTIYPSLLMNTTLSINRDIWIYCFFLWSVYLFINMFIKRGKFPFVFNLLLITFSIAMLGGYRKYALLSFIIGSSIYIMLLLLGKKGGSLKKVWLICIVGFSVCYMALRNYEFPIVGYSLQRVLEYRQLAFEGHGGGSQMGISLDQNNIILFYFNYFYSLISNVLGPFPWQITSVSTLILMLTEGLIFLFISIYLFKQRKKFNNVEMYLFIQGMVWFMLISISNDNFGTGSRLRTVGWIPLLIIFSKHYGRHLYFKKIKLDKSK